MNVSTGCVLFGAALLALWGLAGVYCLVCARRRRQWQARWDEFASRQAGLDAELERTWHYLRR